MSTKVTIQWCDPEHDWELVETTVGDGETHITEVCTSVTTLAAAERMAKYIKAHWDVFDRAPGTAPMTMTFTRGLLFEDIQIGMIITFSPGGVNVRLLDMIVTDDDKLTLTFEVLNEIQAAHPATVLEEMARLVFPDREIDQDAFAQFRSFCDEPETLTFEVLK